MAFQTNCPHCRATISIPDNETRDEVAVQCGNCNQPVRVKLPRAASPDGSTPRPSRGTIREEQSPAVGPRGTIAGISAAQLANEARQTMQPQQQQPQQQQPQQQQPPSRQQQHHQQQQPPGAQQPPMHNRPSHGMQPGHGAPGSVPAPGAFPLPGQVGQPGQPGHGAVQGRIVDSARIGPDGMPKGQGLLGLLEPLLKTQHPTDVSLLLTALVGGTVTALVYFGVLYPLRDTSWGKLFFMGGWIPYGIVFLTFWSMAILALKFWKLMSQKRSFGFDLLPGGREREIDRSHIGQMRSHIRDLPLHQRRNFLVKRVLLALDHYEARGDVQDAAMAVQTQGDIDGGRVESSYTMLHVFIWTVPILGFIGTVLGIGQAVDGFSSSLQSADELDSIKASLTSVTAGLATAFNTTLIALIMSIVIMFPANSLQKSEEDLLTSIDQYCTDNLLPRLKNERTAPTGMFAMPDVRPKRTSDLDALQLLLKAARGTFAARMSSTNSADEKSESDSPADGDESAKEDHQIAGEFTLEMKGDKSEPSTNGESAPTPPTAEDFLAMMSDLGKRLLASDTQNSTHATKQDATRPE